MAAVTQFLRSWSGTTMKKPRCSCGVINKCLQDHVKCCAATMTTLVTLADAARLQAIAADLGIELEVLCVTLCGSSNVAEVGMLPECAGTQQRVWCPFGCFGRVCCVRELSILLTRLTLMPPVAST